MAKQYTRLYHRDQDGQLVPRSTSAGGKRKPYARIATPWSEVTTLMGLLGIMPALLRSEKPDGAVQRRCSQHPEEPNYGCPTCRKLLDDERRAVELFDAQAGITRLPDGACSGKYTRDRPMDRTESILHITLARVKPAKDGSRRVMASEVWWCPTCGAALLDTTKRCPTCGQPKSRKSPTGAAVRRFKKMTKKCERCGFNHVPPVPVHCARCRWELGCKPSKDDVRAWQERLAQTKAMAQAKANKSIAAMAAGKEDRDMGKKKSTADDGKLTGEELLGRDLAWWLEKPTRTCHMLIITNEEHQRTDEEILVEVLRYHPGNRSIYEVGHVGWCRKVALNQYPSTPRPKYIPQGTPVPERLYRDGDGELTTIKPEKASKAVAKAAKNDAPAKKAATKKTAKKATTKKAAARGKKVK